MPFYILIVGICIALLSVGCTVPTQTQQELAGSIRVAGSTALLPLVKTAAKLFEQQHKQAIVKVEGGGSLSGLKQVTSQKVNIGDSDVYADPALYPDPNLTDHIVCVVPFTMIVNAGIGISSLKKQQIIDIFSTGKIRNWNEVGGPDQAIVPIVRPATSGTRATFRKYILDGGDENGTLLQTDSSTDVLKKVAHTVGAIGYIALSVFDNSVHKLGIDGQPASANAIESGSYAFWSYEHMYTLGDSNKITASFLDFMFTPTVQREAATLSYIPIESMKLLSTSAVAGGSSSTGMSISESEATLREQF